MKKLTLEVAIPKSLLTESKEKNELNKLVDFQTEQFRDVLEYKINELKDQGEF